MNIKRKAEPSTKNERCVVALASLLESVSCNPGKYMADIELLDALKRQARLGKYSRPGDGVAPTSRCTIERLSERLFDGGFRSFNELRLEALTALHRTQQEAKKAKRRTKAYVENERDSANIERVRALVDCWHITNAFHRALKEARELANRTRDPALVARWEKSEATLLAMFDLAERPVVKTDTDAEKWLKQLKY